MKNSKYLQPIVQPGKEEDPVEKNLRALFQAADSAIEKVPIPVGFGKAANDIVGYMLRNREARSEKQEMSALLLAWYCLCKDETQRLASMDAA